MQDFSMLIINADDFGLSRLATDRTLSCYKQGSITSASAMVFMEDSQRAADLVREYSIDVGLHLNFTQELTERIHSSLLCDYHDRIIGFLTRTKYNFLIYNPILRKEFEYVFQVQLEEFERLYDMSPSHIDGHHHMHLCANMLIDSIIPEGQKVRRNFTFARGEKSLLNRMYRAAIDKWLVRRYLTADYLFSLSESIKTGRLGRALELSKTSSVELETHPELAGEYEWLMGNEWVQALSNLQRGTYAQLNTFLSRKNNSPMKDE
jgi:predicted glycoside hydrolase/deacetylase ChbG (UPF0249 family)